MELPTEKNAYVTIAILDMPFRVQKNGPYGEAHQNVWQQVMERLEQLQVVGWRVCWARVLDKPTNLAIIVYHPKHHSRRGPEHDTLFLNNILQPLIEVIRDPPRYINLEFDIPSGSAFTTPQNRLTKLFLFDVVTSGDRHDSMAQSIDEDLDVSFDPIMALPITLLQPDRPPPGTIINKSKSYDLRMIRRGQHIPPDAGSYPSNIRHEAVGIEFASKKASERFQEPTKPCTGVSFPHRLADDAWDTEFLQPLQGLQDHGIVIGAERLILESYAWPLVKVVNKIEKLSKFRESTTFDLSSNEPTKRDAEEKVSWLSRALRPFRPVKKPRVVYLYETRSEAGDEPNEIDETIRWVKGHSRTDSGYSSGNYSTITTVEPIRASEEGDSLDSNPGRLKRSLSTGDRLRRGAPLPRVTFLLL